MSDIDDGYPSILDMIRNADMIVAADEARERARTVPQEPWPVDGPLPRAEYVQTAERDAELLTEQKRDLERHADLLKFSPHPTLTALLEAHRPHPYDLGRGRLGYQCHDCPQDWNDGDPSYQSWPCPTWQLIDKETS